MYRLEDLTKQIFSCDKCTWLNCIENKTLSNVWSWNLTSKVIFYGSSFGWDWTKRFLPFGVWSWKVIDKILNAAWKTRQDIYLSNVVKCRLPNLRSPKNYELENCRKYVIDEIDIIKPKLIVPLGSIATRVFLWDFDKLDNVVYKKFSFNLIDLIPMYHPAFIMRWLWDKQKYFDAMIKFMNIK